MPDRGAAHAMVGEQRMQLVGERRMQLSLISEVMIEAISGDQFQSEAIGGNQRRSPGRARSTRALYLNGSP